MKERRDLKYKIFKCSGIVFYLLFIIFIGLICDGYVCLIVLLDLVILLNIYFFDFIM